MTYRVGWYRCNGLDVRLQTSPESLPYPDRTFDLVTAVCVFHHVEPPMRPALLREIRRVLIPGGLFCIIEHNPLNPVTQWIVHRTPVDANAQLLTAGLARGLLAAEALRPICTEYFLLFPERMYKRAKAVESLLMRIPLWRPVRRRRRKGALDSPDSLAGPAAKALGAKLGGH